MSAAAKPDKEVVIHIDKKQFKVSDDAMTGAELRALPEPDIAADYLLKLQVPGGDDRTIADDESVVLANGQHFFSIPKNINPGR